MKLQQLLLTFIVWYISCWRPNQKSPFSTLFRSTFWYKNI